MSQGLRQRVGAIAIGRNEGDRLKACLTSLKRDLAHVYYVDSGSTDDSVAFARSLDIKVVTLDLSRPFTAARARNAGFEAMKADGVEVDFIQFVDGDCEVVERWIEKAAAFLDNNTDVALVCGRRRERFPDASVYNKLCDIEWNTPVGEALASGGDFLVRREAFERVNGFNGILIAGEEPDLCFRLRAKGFKIWRLNEEMTLHDAAMTRLGQWWQRSKRAGYAYANGSYLHGASPERFWRRETLRAIVFGGVLPAVAVIGGLFAHPILLLLLGFFPLQTIRNFVRHPELKTGRLAYSVSCAAGRVPEFFGVAKFAASRFLGRTAKIIEYK